MSNCARLTNLRCKEVINVCDGQRLGFVADVEIILPDGCVQALVVPGPCKFFGLFGRRDDFVIPWHCIRRMGEDIILVELDLDKCRCPRPKPKWF
ncbi:MAG: YlmC/YmxH family sporulation protein [Faecousia sp.]